MKQQIIDHVKQLFHKNKIKGFLAPRQEGEHVGPFLFRDPMDLEQISITETVRYPMVKILMRLQRLHPGEALGVMVRGCEERAIHKLIRASQIDKNKIVLVGLPCSEELAKRCGCLKPYPDSLIGDFKPETPVEPKLVTATPKNFIKDLEFLYENFERCIKCYGCRNICPLCFCRECTLEEETFISKTATPPPPNPDFLLTRAIHMVDFCVYCGLCEEACPAHIPLRTVYKIVANIISEYQGYLIQGILNGGGGPTAPSTAAEASA